MRLSIFVLPLLLGLSPALAAEEPAIRLDQDTRNALAGDLPSGGSVFVDKRAKGGCTAAQYQYVFFNLAGPAHFEAGRWNSLAVAEILAVDGKPEIPLDELANWTIDAASQTDKGIRLTLTELIPPNGSRGDTQTITLQLKGDTLRIPEWSRSYQRCKPPEGEY